MLVKVVSAIGGDVTELDLAPDTPIQQIKSEISRRKRIPSNIFVLAFRGSEIRNESQTLKDIGAGEMDKLYLITRTEGG
ncbi:MAG: ubiquitin-like protein [Candidatus Helarchaeota archaeon]